MKRILITSTELMMIQFLMPHAEFLRENGWDVEAACSEVGGRFGKAKSLLGRSGIRLHKVDLGRSPLRIRNIKGLWELRRLLEKGRYDTVWTNEPVMGVMTRLAIISMKHRPTVMYMAHGFHFYSGAPLKNWLLYYPIEKLLSRYTDVLVTINKEDYKRAKKKLHATKTVYVPGAGVDIKKFATCSISKETKRQELDISMDAFVLLSVGELNRNKNHEVVIRALAQLENHKFHYMIAGQGDLLEYLHVLSSELGVRNRVHLLGYREDISQLHQAADVFVFPSRREGLGLAAIEAMAAGLPLITSNIHGIKDYSLNGKTGYVVKSNDVEGYVDAIRELEKDKKKRIEYGRFCVRKSKKYDLQTVEKAMMKIYLEEEN